MCKCEICGRKLEAARRKYCPGLCEKAGARRAEERRVQEFTLLLRDRNSNAGRQAIKDELAGRMNKALGR